MTCTPEAPANVCRGIQYTFAYYTIALAILGGVAQQIANKLDVRSRAGSAEDAPRIGELSFQEIERNSTRIIDRRLYAMRSGAWFTLSIALVVAAVMSSLVINFPWFYWWGVTTIILALVIVAFPFGRYYLSDCPRLEWLRGIFTDELKARLIFEHDAFVMVDEILKLSPRRFRELKETTERNRSEVEGELEHRREHAKQQQPPPSDEPPAPGAH